jgi:phosphodiesterase/alkaline phosphatase D-like protein
MPNIKHILWIVTVLTLCTAMQAIAQERGEAKAAPEKIIDGPRIEQVTNNEAVIAWTTNSGGSSVVKYGTDQRNLNEMAESPYADKENAKYQTHRVKINNLKPNTTYYFKVVSGQGEDTGTSAQSRVEQFRTK